MQCQATQSRMCINLNGKTGPAGSYKTVSNWLVSQSTKELDFPQSDCMVAFDNDQVVGKSWRVSIDNKVKSSCVTSICAVAIDSGSCNFSNEQFKIANHPKTWFNYTGFVQKLDNIRNQDGTYFDKVYDTHYQMLCHNLNKHISLVYQEQMSRVMRKPTFGICENKNTDQLRGNREADQGVCFRYIHTFLIQNFKPLAIFCSCTAWFVSDQVRNQNVGFLMTRLKCLVMLMVCLVTK